ncbi:unnamed protein product [Trichogramma brassicae]|uniref:Uncharacterized protein n=1 Tax=Trichogramma brassicae TaxID=86971 RepID=A0A6H5I5H4_9HYME|nr:unnamed protein product [Trichogramma brassicae]
MIASAPSLLGAANHDECGLQISIMRFARLPVLQKNTYTTRVLTDTGRRSHLLQAKAGAAVGVGGPAGVVNAGSAGWKTRRRARSEHRYGHQSHEEEGVQRFQTGHFLRFLGCCHNDDGSECYGLHWQRRSLPTRWQYGQLLLWKLLQTARMGYGRLQINQLKEKATSTMAGFKSFSALLLLFVAAAVILVLQAPSAFACIGNGANCQPDGSLGNCCSGFCYKQVGWAMGDCRARMVPHKTARGKDALRRLKAYEGCPPPYDRRKRVVVPGAMRVMCLKPGRKYCHVGRLSHEVGWKYKAVVRTLENKRRVKSIMEVQKRNGLKVNISFIPFI